MMSRAPWMLCALALTALCLTSPPVAAQNASGIAAERFKEGVKHYDGRRYEEARVAFLQAFALDAKGEHLLYLGHAELRVGMAVDAATHLARYLREHPEASADDRQEADLDFAAARTKVAEAHISADDGAEIFVDETSLGRAPLGDGIFVAPGMRSFRAVHGQTEQKRSVDAAPGGEVTVELRGAPPTATGPAAAPETSMEPDDTGGPSSRRMPLPQWFIKTPIAWVGAGVGVAGLVVGTTFAVTSKTHFDRADDIRRTLIAATSPEPPCDPPPTQQIASGCAERADSASAGETQRTVAIVGFVLGGVALAGTVVYYFVDPHAWVREESALRFTPYVSSGERGVAVSGTF